MHNAYILESGLVHTRVEGHAARDDVSHTLQTCKHRIGHTSKLDKRPIVNTLTHTVAKQTNTVAK